MSPLCFLSFVFRSIIGSFPKTTRHTMSCTPVFIHTDIHYSASLSLPLNAFPSSL